MARAARVGLLLLTHLRSDRFADPKKHEAEDASAFGGPAKVARDLDLFDSWEARDGAIVSTRERGEQSE